MNWHTYKLYFGTSRGKNALKKAYLQKSLSFLDTELELLKLKIIHPEQFPKPNPQTFKSNLHIIPKSKGLGIVGLAEIVVSLHLSGEVKGMDGKPATLISIARAFGTVFNVNPDSIYDKQGEVFRRKPYNLTKCLDVLKNFIVREDRKRNNR